MKTGKYYLTKEEQLQREKRDWYSMEKTAKTKGKEEGIEIGHKEEKIEIALKMLKKGMDVELIAELTELPIEEIHKLQENENR